MAKLEEQAAVIEGEVKTLNDKLSDQQIYSDPTNLKKTKRDYSEKQDELKQVQKQWEALAEQIMELEA